MTVPNRPKEGIYTIWKKKFQEKLHVLEDMALNSTIYIYIYEYRHSIAPFVSA